MLTFFFCLAAGSLIWRRKNNDKTKVCTLFVAQSSLTHEIVAQTEGINTYKHLPQKVRLSQNVMSDASLGRDVSLEKDASCSKRRTMSFRCEDGSVFQKTRLRFFLVKKTCLTLLNISKPNRSVI